ncbi:MAG: hypothetical protein IPH13_04425 [Planctomycetes bacterium]|nr:hypothetical protein [Planctomycetota bacterium]MCC7169549.1 hypothetical protein [Planctomycetota bacterium]
MMRRVAWLGVWLVGVSGGASAQTLSQSAFVVGQPVTMAITGAQPGDPIALFVGFSGLGAGPCVQPYNACFALNLPWTVLFVLPADAQGSVALNGVLPSALPLVPVYTQAAVVHGSTLTPTNAIATTIEPISALSDDFAAGVLDAAWTIHNGPLMQWSLSGGALELEPALTGPASIWFDDHEGPALLRSITGDFDVRSTVRVFDPAAPNQPPAPFYRLAGLVARSPQNAPGALDWVHVAIGGGDGSVPFAFEDKTTDDSVSDFLLHPGAAMDSELRIVRQGATFTLFARPVGAPQWQLLRSHVRPDLPATLEVGPMTYSLNAPAGIRARFEDFTVGP